MSVEKYCFTMDISAFVPEHDKWTPRSVLKKLNLSVAKQNIEIKSCVGLDLPNRSRYRNKWYCYVTLSVEVNGKTSGLVTAARKMSDCFGKPTMRAQLHGDMNFPVNVAMILHDADKRRRRAGWRGGENHHYIEADGLDHVRVHYSVIFHAYTTDVVEAGRICDQQAEELAIEVDATSHIDMPVQPNGDKSNDCWAAYDFGVRVEKKDEFDMVESSALRLSAAIKGKPIYVELDDPHATPLSRLVGYIIPKRRGTLCRN